VLVHPGEVILPELGVGLGRYAQKKLADRGVEIRVKTKVSGYDGHEVVLNDGTKIATRGGNWFTRQLGAGYPDLDEVVTLLEKHRTGTAP